MSREKDPECRGLLMDETPLAILVCKEHSPVGGESWWIPRGQIGYMKIDRAVPAGALPRVVFTCPEWLLESKQAWDLVP